jgi:2-phospho-L-lactate/phosphoenolpyruvate guanylyltransferase
MVHPWQPRQVVGWPGVIFVGGAGRCRGEHKGTDTINEMCSPNIDQWRLVVPVKCQWTAKSRLHPPDGVARADLAHAIALDTISAAVASIPADQLIVVTSDEPTATFVRGQGGVVLPDPGDGLNSAIRSGVWYAGRVLGPGPVAVLLGDVPALRPEDLNVALSACAGHQRALVPDASGTGTVLLTARSWDDLNPRFGPGSALEHSRDCVRLDLDLPALRTDVDDDQALRRAVTIGVGRHTAVVLGLP